jgi:Mg2+-importing ATPase
VADHAPPSAPPDGDAAFWAGPAAARLAALRSGTDGLRSDEAARRLREHGPNAVAEAAVAGPWRLALRQFQSPLVLILVFGAGVSLLLADWLDAAIILAVVLGSTLLGFAQEYRASNAVAALRARLALTTRVWRDGALVDVPARELVPGDVIELAAGHLIPADGRVLAATDFLVTEASLTGESFPVEKRPADDVPADAPLAQRTNAVFLGTSVRSGTARALVVRTGAATAYGAIAARVRTREPETEFARGIHRFGRLLVRVMVVMVLFVLSVNHALDRPVIDSLLFAVALAVGLSPELLPAILSVTLSAGARQMAREGVIVRRLEAIENLGSIDVLCTDKTGTLTLGQMTLEAALDADGADSADVLRWACLNAAFETGIDNPLDAALVAAAERQGLTTAGWRKVDEIPYDFERRRLTIVVAEDSAGADASTHLLITKGAVAEVLAQCSAVWRDGAAQRLDDATRERLQREQADLGQRGLRVLALAVRRLSARADYDRGDERDLAFAGFLVFVDPPKPDAAATLRTLKALHVDVKVLTGDNRHVAAHVARAVGLDAKALLTGEQVAAMRDEALWHLAPRTALFVELDPQQKERIVRALQRTGHAVGYLGDGINDAPPLHAADVGISVDRAVDVARESADVVLLQSDLGVLARGVQAGRRTMANTLKYIGITTSANFGNMVSMALATPLLPFLPLLAKQILLNNFLTDLPSNAISSDRVDADQLARPTRWSIDDTRRFMIVFGLVSSVFDLITFALLLKVFDAGEREFQTAWFVVSLLTELVVVLVLRTRRAAWRSAPSRLLWTTTLAVGATAVLLPYVGPVAALFGLQPLPPALLAAALAVVAAYAASTEVAKRLFYRGRQGRRRLTPR